VFLSKTIYEIETKYETMVMIEFDKKYEAPALARGLGLLKIMMNGKEFSLEELAEKTNAPKSSLLRLLDTLQQLNYVSKCEITKKYSSSKSILEKRILPRSEIINNLPTIMASICYKLSRSVEWYVLNEVGMTLMERCIPHDQEVQVRAKIGFIRKWATELEAVSCLGYAFRNSKIEGAGKLYTVNEKKDLIKLPNVDFLKHIENARSNEYVYDKHYNSNGIRRAAIPILNNQDLLGILAVAEHKSFNHPIKGKDLISLLQNEISNQ